jgi:uncharacterized protein (TIGR01777 family)
MKTVLISGGTGMVGQALTNTLVLQGYQVIILTRNPKKSSRANVSFANWNIDTNEIDADAIKSSDIIIHLAGASVAEKRWTEKRKQEIIDSRVQSSKLLVHAIKTIPNHITTFISASAIGWYGPDTETSLQNGFVETDPMDPSYLGTTCGVWEASVQEIATLGIRLVITRIGIVLNKRGGALKAMLIPARLGCATIFGHGNQRVSWIHQKDLSQLFVFAIENEQVQGIYNAVAPESITNKKLVTILAKKAIGFSIPISVPSFLLRLIMGEMSIEILKSAHVSSKKIQEAGFVFQYPTIDQAIEQILH